MLSVLLITFPFFALVLCGYLAARGGVLPQPAIPGLNAFVLYFALPCMLYRFGAGTPIHQLLDPAVAGVYLLCALAMVGGTVALTRNARIGWNDAAFGALVAAFPNTGFMGVPLLIALLGAQSAGPAIVTIVVDMVVTSSLCIALSRLDGAGTHGVGVALRQAFRGMATNPMPWSIALGALASALQLRLPGPVDKTVAMLADAASPVALFTIGAVLARSQMNQHERVPARDYVPVALAKLLAHPLLVWAVPGVFGLFEAPTDGTQFIRQVGTLWLALGAGGLLFRTVHLFFIADVKTGLVWMTKILTDPFHDIKLYYKAPLYLMRGQLIDPGVATK